MVRSIADGERDENTSAQVRAITRNHAHTHARTHIGS